MADPKTGQLAQPEDFETPQQPAEQPKAQDVGYVKTPRDIAREEMARRAQQRRERSDASFKVDELQEDGTIVPAVVEKTPEQPLPEPEEAAPDTRDTSQVTESERTAAESEQKTNKSESPSDEAPAAPEQERELIVDGKCMRVPISRIWDAGVRTLQKESAADMRLAAATELLRTAQERQVVQQPPAQQAPSDEDALLARQIQFGTEEEAKAAIARLRNAAPAITPQQIDTFVQQRLSQVLPEHAAFNEANSWLRTEYKQITQDPDLKFLFDVKEDQARKAGDRRPYKELYQALAGEIATKFNLRRNEPTPPNQPIETTQASDRLTRKANSPRPVTGASGRMEQAQPKTKATSVADYVTRQRQLRGLQPLDKQGI